MNKEALFYERNNFGSVSCKLCPRHCIIEPGNCGFCRVRENKQGVLYATNYGECSAYGLDPIEKKPLYHFHPGAEIMSLGTRGCNLHCGFCQNWQIAHGDPKTVYLSPEKAVELALSGNSNEGQNCIGLAYTYSEPFVWYEYVYDTALIARETGLKNVMVTNGYVNQEPLRKILPYLDAMNIDLKGFTDKYYSKVCLGQLMPVIQTVEAAAGQCHVEITTLLVPGLNDSPREIEELSKWLAGLDKNIPLHFSRYFPSYKFDLLPTPVETIENAVNIAKAHLNYVYAGNAPELGLSNTYCPDCSGLLINRNGYGVELSGLKEDCCIYCGYKIKIIL
ncbi:MAG: AmmeMemoRadiSam system radical SAM enzyme [Peptococcaceae bacterium]|nr:AmmeMemoRadiSam system radical SAM enzyme [Peptococcaceae bacterium]